MRLRLKRCINLWTRRRSAGNKVYYLFLGEKQQQPLINMIEEAPIRKVTIWFLLLLVVPLSSWYLVSKGLLKDTISPQHGSFVAIVMVNVVLFMIIAYSVMLDYNENLKKPKPKYKIQ